MTLGASGTEIVGVIVGAVILFTLVSAVPVIIARIRRRRDARQQPEMQTNNTHPSFISGPQYPDNGPMPMQQVFVERWLEQQYAPTSTEPYSHDICSCLSTLGFRSTQDTLPMPPEAALIPASQSYVSYDGHNDHRHCLSPRTLEECWLSTTNSDIRVLNRCGHAFHASCLASSFQYGQHRCPICQTAYFPE